jgi:hypothetical protein
VTVPQVPGSCGISDLLPEKPSTAPRRRQKSDLIPAKQFFLHDCEACDTRADQHAGVVDERALLSGQKTNNSNWLPISFCSNVFVISESACGMGIFLKRVTEKICSKV